MLVSVASISLPSYSKEWTLPLVNFDTILLGGCFGTVSDSSAAALAATRVVLPLNAAALPLASVVDTVLKRERLWQSVNVCDI